VIDTGIGIKESDFDIILQPFQQAGTIAGKPRTGTGLGLSICNKLVTMLGGRIFIESTPGKGSTFTFTLPLSRAQTSKRTRKLIHK
jgi:signal transduction histidine kinase